MKRYNGKNRMAFEYLMAIYLQTDALPAAVKAFSFLDNLSYPAVPPLYEEAAMIYGAKHPEEVKATNSGIFFRGRKISEPTMNKLRRFHAIVKP